MSIGQFFTDLWHWLTGRGWNPAPKPVIHFDEINWHASTTTGVTYNVYRAPLGGMPNLLVAGLTTLSYEDKDVKAGATYEYWVQAVDSVGIGSKLDGPITLTAE